MYGNNPNLSGHWVAEISKSCLSLLLYSWLLFEVVLESWWLWEPITLSAEINILQNIILNPFRFLIILVLFSEIGHYKIKNIQISKTNYLTP